MSIDLFQSRRNYNEPCKWWSRQEIIIEETGEITIESPELVMKRAPNGTFMAKETSPENYENNVIGGNFMFDKTTVTIKTPDNVEGIKNNDLVEYEGEKWIVIHVQKIKARMQNTMFARDAHCSHYWFIEMRK